MPMPCPRRLYHPLCYTDKHWNRVDGDENLRRQRPVARRAVRPDSEALHPVE